MPSLYSHYRYGGEVYKLLPQEYKKIVDKYPKQYSIGLQGPDIFFFYREEKSDKHRRKGYTLHREDAYYFFKNSLEITKRYGKDSGQFSYIIGYILHYALDSECHPPIMIAEKETGCTHAEVECDLDYLCLEKDGFVPDKYNLSKIVPTDPKVCESILPYCDEDMSASKIGKTLRRMKRIKRFYYTPHRIKRAFVLWFLKMKKNPNRLYQQGILRNRNSKCKESVDLIFDKAEASIEYGRDLIVNYAKALDNPDILSTDLHKDYLGRIKA